jgi:hypothetical protein
VVGAVTVHVAPPGEAVTVYEVTGEPFSLAGGSKETEAESAVFPAVITADTFCGADGAETAITAVEACEAVD